MHSLDDAARGSNVGAVDGGAGEKQFNFVEPLQLCDAR